MQVQAQAQTCVMQAVRVSGTIRKAEEEAIRRAKADITKAKVQNVTGEKDGLDELLASLIKDDGSKGVGDGVEKMAGTEDSMEDEDEDEDIEDA